MELEENMSPDLKRVRREIRQHRAEVAELQDKLEKCRDQMSQQAMSSCRLNGHTKADVKFRALNRTAITLTREIRDARIRIEELTEEAEISRASTIGASPGWRWVPDFVGHYVWDETGRVARLVELVYSEGFFLKLMTPRKGGCFDLKSGSVKRRLSCFKFAESSKLQPVVLEHVDADDNEKCMARWVADLGGHGNIGHIVEIR